MEGLKRRVLYVDDEMFNLELFILSYEEEYDIVIATSAEKALEILENHKIPVVVSDLKMPGLNGLELIEIIKNKWPQTVCMLLTAYIDSDVLLKALNQEMIFRYLLKPWSRKELKNTIDNAFDRFEQQN
jgi:response regulator RpfG family c-di-GMP phosphodiesterase